MNTQVAKLIEHYVSLIAGLQTDMNMCKTNESKIAINQRIIKYTKAIEEFKQCL